MMCPVRADDVGFAATAYVSWSFDAHAADFEDVVSHGWSLLAVHGHDATTSTVNVPPATDRGAWGPKANEHASPSALGESLPLRASGVAGDGDAGGVGVSHPTMPIMP